MQTWVQILVGLASIAVIVQTAIMLAILVYILRLAQRIESIATEVERHVSPILTRVHSLIEEAQPRIVNMLSDAAEVTHLARLQVQRVDRVATEALDRVRMQLAHFDQILTGVLEMVEDSGQKVRRTVWGPIQSVVSVVRGIQAGLDFWRGRKGGGSRRPRGIDDVGEGIPEQQDESLFI